MTDTSDCSKCGTEYEENDSVESSAAALCPSCYRRRKDAAFEARRMRHDRFTP